MADLAKQREAMSLLLPRCYTAVMAKLRSTQGDAVPGDLRNVFEGIAGFCHVPVNEPDELILPPNHIPRAQITMTNDLACGPTPVGIAPYRIGRRDEVGDRTVIGVKRFADGDDAGVFQQAR